MSMTKEMAENEVKIWLKQHKRLRDSQINSESLEQAIEYIAEAIVDGAVTIEENGFMVQKLTVKTVETTELKFKPTLTASEFAVADKYKENEGNKRNICTIARATDNMEAVISKLESPDYNLAKIIALFYSV